MGLCKCPKKKVTNLFCFEHRVNVCEHCLVANHSKCIVQSYLQWLQDSDYDPACRLCGKNLADDSNSQCVRLTCYDVFHWSCLDEFAHKLPPNTAPAGYTCPVCHAGLFPAANAASPVVDSLRELLSTVNWARAGLGLPMIAESPRQMSNGMAVGTSAPIAVHSPSTPPRPAQDASNVYRPQQNVQPVQSVISIDETVPYARSVDRSEVLNNFQKIVSGIQDDLGGLNASDHDHDKYKRRPALQWLDRWFSSRTTPASHMRRDPNAGVKRFFIIALLVLIAFVTVVIVFAKLGRSMTDSDPFLDPMANPNIRVQEDTAVEA